MDCKIILPCGHECSNSKKTSHLEHERQKCRKKCKKQCSRNHKCEKLCWEDCGPCKHPVSADLLCKHEALLPCHAVDSYQCQELCNKVLCSEGHTCRKECWEECGPCKVPIALQLPCSHHTIIPCYLNDDSFKCKEKCGRIQKCEFQHECEKECWENCIPCTNRVRRDLSCGHDIILPCHVDIEKFKCNKICEKKLCSNHHKCRKFCWEDCGPCKNKMGFTLPCSHKVILPCGSNIENYVCRQTCEKILCKLGHKCQNICWENCSKCQCIK